MVWGFFILVEKSFDSKTLSNQHSEKTIGSERSREEKAKEIIKEEIKSQVILPKTTGTVLPLKGMCKINF